MKITKEKIVSIIIRFFTERKKTSYYTLAEKVGVDQKSIKEWEMQERKNIRNLSAKQLISGLESDISSEFENFSEYVIAELGKDGIKGEYIWEIFDKDTNIFSIIEQLQELDISEQKTIQESIGTANIIRILKSFLVVYREYFQVNEKAIGEGGDEFVYFPLIYSASQAKNCDNFITDRNYLVLKFPSAYYVGIILCNYVIDYSDTKAYGYYLYMIEKLKSQNDLKMILFITDIDKKRIPFEIQSSLMEKYNLFFEFVNEADLQDISMQDFKLPKEETLSLSKINQHRYAQLIFERFMSYLAVISNEIIFQPYLGKLHKELDREGPEKVDIALNKILVSYQKRTPISNFTNYANEVLLKEICRYSYLSRHTIYYERTLVANKVESFLGEHLEIEKLPLVVEICAPNSLTTCNIIDKCEKLLLFTTSHNAYSLMTKLEEKTGHRFLPSNVLLRLCHLNPEYMMHQYPDELNGKVDLLVIGYGAGSQISDLTRFIRYAYNWLSENGVLFISLYNKEAIVLNKNHIHDQRFESSPLYLSDYWTYTLNEQPPLLKKLKAYSPESIQSSYFAFFDTQNINISTYPYISALINPSEYSREILDEIREADKLFALKGIHGQLIDVIVHKNKPIKKPDTRIKDYLVNHDIKYDYYVHTLAPDSKSLRRSLQAKNVSMQNATLLKVVVLQEKNPKSPHRNCWSYAILPYDEKVVYDHMIYELVPETFVTKRFNQGTISPLIVLAEREENQESCERIFLLYNDRINTEYVIMGGGSNTESIRIRTRIFRRIIKRAKISLQSIIE
ncbi:MAG: hypothetical protein NC123_12095 [Butyrivibrio sp.]|nr:hypothetical protein [Ruminococcus flavefaciens]MCM1560263.1 hypothetical protein [Butyrivibrio sp.]